MSDDNKTARMVIDGYAYVRGNGRLVIDRHPTDAAHLEAGATRTEQPLYDCRTYVRDAFPAEWLGRPGRFTIERIEDAAGRATAVWVAFAPHDQRAGG